MRKKTWAALAALTSLGLALAGCSSDRAPAGGSDPSEDTGQLSGEISMWVPPTSGNAETDTAYWEATAAAFTEENPGVTVKVEVIPFDKRSERLTTAIAGRSTPDVTYVLPPDVANYGGMGALADVSAVVADDEDDFRDNALSAMSVDGTLYAVPALMTVTTMIMNKEVLDAVGVPAPESWDDIRAIAPKLKDAGYYVTQYEGAPTQTLNGSFYPLLWQAGGSILDDTGTKAAFNDEAGVKAVEFVKWLVDNDYAPRDSISTALPVETSPVANGKVLSVFSRSLASMTSNGLSEDSIIETAPLRDEEQVSYGTVGGFAVFEASRNTQAAEEWIRFITSAEQLRTFLPAAKAHSPRLSVTDLYPSGSPLAVDGAQLDYMTVGLTTAKSAQIMEILKPQLQAAILGTTPVKQALDNAAAEVDALLAK